MTKGPLAPTDCRWFDWILGDVGAGATSCNNSLITYGGRADPELVVALEKLRRIGVMMTHILQQIERQKNALFESVGRDYFSILLREMAKAEATWRGWLDTVYSKGHERQPTTPETLDETT